MKRNVREQLKKTPCILRYTGNYMTIKNPLIYNFFGKSDEFQFKWLNLLTYDIKTSETTFLNFWPPPLVSRGSKSSKIRKKTRFFNKINLWSENGRFCPFFFISYFERGMFGHDVPQKKSWGKGGGKFSTGLFLKKWKKIDTFFFDYSQFWPPKFLCLPPIFLKKFFD